MNGYGVVGTAAVLSERQDHMLVGGNLCSLSECVVCLSQNKGFHRQNLLLNNVVLKIMYGLQQISKCHIILDKKAIVTCDMCLSSVPVLKIFL